MSDDLVFGPGGNNYGRDKPSEMPIITEEIKTRLLKGLSEHKPKIVNLRPKGIRQAVQWDGRKETASYIYEWTERRTMLETPRNVILLMFGQESREVMVGDWIVKAGSVFHTLKNQYKLLDYEEVP